MLKRKLAGNIVDRRSTTVRAARAPARSAARCRRRGRWLSAALRAPDRQAAVRAALPECASSPGCEPTAARSSSTRVAAADTARRGGEAGNDAAAGRQGILDAYVAVLHRASRRCWTGSTSARWRPSSPCFERAHQEDRQIFIVGNGGSAATASHMAATWQGHARQRRTRRPPLPGHVADRQRPADHGDRQRPRLRARFHEQLRVRAARATCWSSSRHRQLPEPGHGARVRARAAGP